jgi:hypothetical protein
MARALGNLPSLMDEPVYLPRIVINVRFTSSRRSCDPSK